jgi:hypothetical protein
MKCWMCITAVVLALLAPAAHADLIPGKPRGPVFKAPPNAPVVVVVDDKATETHVQIPRALLGQLRADAGDASDPNTRRAEALPPLHLAVAGAALALALTFGGLWLVRSRVRTSRSNVVLLLVAATALAIGATSLWANVAAPIPKEKPTTGAQDPKVPAGGITLADKAVIEVVDKGDAITLIVKSADLAAVVQKSAPPPVPVPKKTDKEPEPSK